MYRKLGLFLLVFLLIACCFSGGCKQGEEQSAELTEVQLCEVVRSIFYAPQYVAISQGFFEDEGLNIELSTAQGADKVMTALLSDNADIGLAGAEASIYVYNQGQENYVINFAQLTKRDGSFLVGRQAQPAFQWESLKGKTIIGGRPGGMPEMVLEHVLQQHGLTPGEDVNIITNLQFTATAGAFSGGTGDYVALFEPTATLLEKEGAGCVVASIGTASGELPYTVYMARKGFIEEKSLVVQKFTNAIYRAQQWVASQPPENVAAAIAEFFPDADQEVLTQVVKRYQEQDTWKVSTVMDEASFNYLQEIISAAGELDQKVDPEILINTEFSQKAKDE